MADQGVDELVAILYRTIPSRDCSKNTCLPGIAYRVYGGQRF
jgi:hypothetical protein